LPNLAVALTAAVAAVVERTALANWWVITDLNSERHRSQEFWQARERTLGEAHGPTGCGAPATWAPPPGRSSARSR
jgi:hypothetical protein